MVPLKQLRLGWGVEMELRHTLVRPLVTEKTTTILAGNGAYAFEVHPDANKFDVKRAIESFYGVDVVAIRTLVMRGKVKRSGRHIGKRKNWKKAYVTLAEGQSLNVLDG